MKTSIVTIAVLLALAAGIALVAAGAGHRARGANTLDIAIR